MYIYIYKIFNTFFIIFFFFTSNIIYNIYRVREGRSLAGIAGLCNARRFISLAARAKGEYYICREGAYPQEPMCSYACTRCKKTCAGTARVYCRRTFLRCTCSCATDECTVSTGCRRSWTDRDGPEGVFRGR